MRGEWFDAVSCCVTFSRGSRGPRYEDTMRFRHCIVRLMSLCHGSALEEIGGEEADFCETIDRMGLDSGTLGHLKDCQQVYKFNRVEVLLHMIQSLIAQNLENGVLKVQPPILSRVYQTLSRGFVNLLNAKKIADTRFPFPFAQLISGLLILHVVILPILISATVSEARAPGAHRGSEPFRGLGRTATLSGGSASRISGSGDPEKRRARGIWNLASDGQIPLPAESDDPSAF
ncbi:unnamed protein product [Effrenium voratum]|nr:unnamed protein product [Effrenium voratum]